MNKLDWKGVGQFVAVLVQVWSLIKEVVVETKVGLEILGWIVGDGREWFKRFLGELVAEYKKSLPSEPEEDHVIDFDSKAVCPEGLKVASADWQIESRVRGFHKPEDIQISLGISILPTGTLTLNRGYEVCKQLRALRAQVLGPQLLDFYLKHPNLVPEEVKTGDWVCFWGTVYEGESRNVYVRCLRWDGTSLVQGRFRLGDLWTKCFKVAVWVSPRKTKKEHIIDFDSAPAIPAGLTIAPDGDQITTRVRGKRNLSSIKIRLHLDDDQTNGKSVKGYDLKAKLEGQEVFGAQLLDLYLKHLDFIPEYWKTKGLIFFWGTIYRDDNGNLYVRYLCWSGTRWVKNCHWLGGGWDDSGLAAVSASLQV